MSQPWFRVYHELLDDPKLQGLPDGMFKLWLNMMCVACRYDGNLPTIEECSFLLRKDKKYLIKAFNHFISIGLIDQQDQHLKPHNWDGRQYKSDTSKERTKDYRQRLKEQRKVVTSDSKGDGIVTSQVTPPDTDTDTERYYTTSADAPEVVNKNKHSEGGGGKPDCGQVVGALCEIFKKYDFLPPGNVGVYASQWIADGAKPDLDIFPVIDRMCHIQVKSGKYITTAKFFHGAVQDAITQRKEIANGKRSNSPGRKPTSTDRFIDGANSWTPDN